MTKKPPFLLLVLISSTGVMVNTLIVAALPEVRDEFGLSTSALALVVAAGTAPGIVLAPIIGLLADRFGRREMLMACLLIYGVAGGLVLVVGSYGPFLALRLLQSVGAAGLSNLATVLVGDHWQGIEQARLIGRKLAANAVALTTLPLVGGLLTTLSGWRASFAPFLLALPIAVVVAVAIPRSDGITVTTLADQLHNTVSALRSRIVAGSIAMLGTVFILIFGLMLTLWPIHLAQAFHLNATTRGLVIGLPALSAMIASLLIGRLHARFRVDHLLEAAFAAFAVSFFVMGTTNALAVAIMAVIVYGFAEGLILPSLVTVITGSATTAARGAVVATFIAFNRVGQTIGPILAGGLAQLTGITSTFVAGGLVAGGLAIAARAIFTGRQTIEPEPVPALTV